MDSESVLMISNPLCQACWRQLLSCTLLWCQSWFLGLLVGYKGFLPLAETKHQSFAKLPATEIGDAAVNSLLHRAAEL